MDFLDLFKDFLDFLGPFALESTHCDMPRNDDSSVHTA
jgi:hypothetical protein